jgi:hypothetical protein
MDTSPCRHVGLDEAGLAREVLHQDVEAADVKAKYWLLLQPELQDVLENECIAKGGNVMIIIYGYFDR